MYLSNSFDLNEVKIPPSFPNRDDLLLKLCSLFQTVSPPLVCDVFAVFLPVKAFSFDGGDSSSESELGGTKPDANCNAPSGTTGPHYPPRHDLMSLAEKGRMGISSNSSCCSSTTSSIGDKHGLANQLGVKEKTRYDTPPNPKPPASSPVILTRNRTLEK